MDDWGLQYLGYNWQYMTDIVNIYLPVNGKFDSNLFMPANPFIFYLQWIFLTLAYFGGLSWLSVKFAVYWKINIDYICHVLPVITQIL
jgi:hypothetical protein